MAKIGIIGGTGLANMQGLEIVRREMVATPFGPASGPVIHGQLEGCEVAFLARHGYNKKNYVGSGNEAEPHRAESHLEAGSATGNSIPPHKVNYRANIWAMREIGVKQIIAVNAVGGIAPDCGPLQIVIPDQIIDYTHGRAHTYSTGEQEYVHYAEFTEPYSEQLRAQLLKAAANSGHSFVDAGVYGATQGPRLETAAEIQRLKRDGCTIVGMTGMPEAGLARELGLQYASSAYVVNWAAGMGDEQSMEQQFEQYVQKGVARVQDVLRLAISYCQDVA